MKTISQMFKNLKIQNKIFLSSCFVLSLFVIVIFAYFFPKVEEDIVKQKRIKLKEITEVCISMIQDINQEYLGGIITEEEAQSRAIQLIKNIRYGPEGKDYLWINDYHPKMIMHPYVTELNGKDISDYKDPNGKRLFVEMVDVCKEKGKGYVDYMWQWKDEQNNIVPKISYVEAFEPWGWIIGTGVYIEDVKEEIWALKLSMILVFIAVTAFMLIFFYFIARMISKSFSQVIGFSNKIAEGDFTERLEVDRQDECGMLARAMNSSVENIEKLITRVIISAQNLAQAIEQITKGNQSLSQRTSEQASSLEEIASTIEEATATIKQNAENAQEANRMSDESLRLGNEGDQVVVEAVASINDISESSKKIGEIISVINEIAFQTNLLALNAAVEAARAGEQGRGFAVVAGEVRNLAQRAGSAAKEIGDLIKDSVGKVDRGTELSNKSGESLKQIVESIKKMGQIISEIAAASEEQRQGINQINIAVSEMDSMTQQNAALVEETASASEEMANQAQELMALMNRFKVKDIEVFGQQKELHLRAAEINEQNRIEMQRQDGGDGDGRDKSGTVERRKKAEIESLMEQGFEEF